VTYRGRFAPSPTGDLHLGSAATALIAWLRARRAGGVLILRIEDLDTPRVIAASVEGQLDDLRWLGLDWDEGPGHGGACGPYRQSQRTVAYEQALSRLATRGLTYLCDCSRSDIASIASAPHAGEEGPRYPGTCRPLGMQVRAWRRPPAVRLAVPDGDVTIDDLFQGRLQQNVFASVGDFVLRRGDGIFAYQLAVVVDDTAMAVTEVVRGCDLLSSTARQILLAELLGETPPAYAHVPLIVDNDGNRLQKRDPHQTLRGLRDLGLSAERVIGSLAATLRLVAADTTSMSLPALLDAADLSGLQQRHEARLPLLT